MVISIIDDGSQFKTDSPQIQNRGGPSFYNQTWNSNFDLPIAAWACFSGRIEEVTGNNVETEKNNIWSMSSVHENYSKTCLFSSI